MFSNLKTAVAIPLMFVLYAGLTANTQASSNELECWNSDDLMACLDRYADSLLKPGSEADQIFKEEMSEILHNYTLNHEVIPLQEMFRLTVARKGDTDVSDGGACFSSINEYFYRETEIKDIMNQMAETANFLALFHSRALGKKVSLLFQIRTVKFCDLDRNEGREMVIRNRTLHVGIDVDGGDIMSAIDMLDEWNSSDPLRGSDYTLLSAITPQRARDIKHVVKGKKMDVLRDRLAEKWELLNPIGDLRFNLRTVVLGEVLGYIFNKGLGGQDQPDPLRIAKFFRKMLQHDAFTQKERDWAVLASNEDLIQAFEAWRNRATSPEILREIFDANLFSEKESGNVFIMDRKCKFNLVSVMNSHEIQVSVDSIMPSIDRPIMTRHLKQAEEARKQHQLNEVKLGSMEKEIKINASGDIFVDSSDQSFSLVCVNTHDYVDVSVNIPKISSGLIQRISLSEIIEGQLDGIGLH
jgi:hypothetical protein